MLLCCKGEDISWVLEVGELTERLDIDLVAVEVGVWISAKLDKFEVFVVIANVEDGLSLKDFFAFLRGRVG